MYGVVRTSGFVAKCIRRTTESRYNHAFVYIGRGEIVEATARGAVVSPASKYPSAVWNDEEPLTDEQRHQVRIAASYCVGAKYGFLDVVALALAGWGMRAHWLERRLSRTDRLICSQLVDVCYRKAGVALFDDDDRLPQNVTPGDLAERITRRPWSPSTF